MAHNITDSRSKTREMFARAGLGKGKDGGKAVKTGPPPKTNSASPLVAESFFVRAVHKLATVQDNVAKTDILQSRARAITSKDTPQKRPLVLVTPNRKWSSGGEWRMGGGGTSWRQAQFGGAMVHRTPHTEPFSTGADEPRSSDDRVPCGTNPKGPPTEQVGHAIRTQEPAPRNVLEVPGGAGLAESDIPWRLPPHMRIGIPGAKLPWTTPPVDPSLRDHPVSDYGTSRGRNLAGETWEGVLARWAESTFHDDDESRGETVDGRGALSSLDVRSAWSAKYHDVDWGALRDYSQDPKSIWGDTVIESKGAALLPVQNIIFGPKSRIEWRFSADEDERVLSFLAWIEAREFTLGEFGLHRFLQTRQRGALFTNVNYRPEQNPQLPAFDWIAFDDLQQTNDKFMRESVAHYDLALNVVVFVVRPSITGDSVAIWMRQISVPNIVQLVFKNEIKLAIGGLRDREAQSCGFAEEEPTRKGPGNISTQPEILDQLRLRPACEGSPHVIRDVIQSPQSSDISTDGVPHCRNGLYQDLFNLIRQEIASSPRHKPVDRIQKALQEASETSGSLSGLLALSCSHQYRAQLMKICSDLGILDSSSVREALQNDEKHIFLLLQQIVLSAKNSNRKAVLELQGKDAESFMDFLQTALDRYRTEDSGFCRGARRLLVKLSEVSGVIPASLTIRGVTLLEKEAIFGGGFADIYRASYNGKDVALKRMRVFERGQERHKIHQTFCKEALIWQSLRHPHVVPFLGVDSDTFLPHLCMVSPWMQHGTIMQHLSVNTDFDVKNLLREVVQGLDYLHSQKVVHGDLRGSNILINDERQACLADFGLTAVSDVTLATQTSNGHGSVRWMAPELHDPESFGLKHFLQTPASDIYAFGCVCLEVYTSKAPFAYAANDSAVILQVMRGLRPQRPPPDANRHMPDDVWGLIERCWKQMPSERLDIHEIIDITEKWK